MGAQLQLLQRATPALAAVALVLAAGHGEQQRGAAGLLDLTAERAKGHLTHGVAETWRKEPEHG